MTLKMMKSTAAATKRKTSSSLLPPSLVLAATVLMVIAAIATLITLALSVIATEFSSSLGGISVLGIGASPSLVAKGISDPNERSIGDPNEVVLRR
jgi:hypothetical protein